MVTLVTDKRPGTFVHTLADAHLYVNHMEQADEQLSRAPRPLPKLWLNPAIRHIDDFIFNDIRLDGYNPHAEITAPSDI